LSRKSEPIHRRPLCFERCNAASMQHDAVTAADLEHCRSWLLEGASHCSSCEARIVVLLATDAYFLPMIPSPAPQGIPLLRALADTRPAMTACMAGDEPSRTAKRYPMHACAWHLVRLYEPRASFPTRAALGFVRKRYPPLGCTVAAGVQPQLDVLPNAVISGTRSLPKGCPEQA
jgi:hypothetical protein